MKTDIRMKGLFRACVVTIALAAILTPAIAHAKQVNLDVAVGNPLVLAGKKQTAYLRVAMTGFELEDAAKRAPVNLAIVLDKSGSMQGDKIARAKEAAIMAIEKLRDDDIVSVIVYDSTVSVVVPATKVSDRQAIYAAIRSLRAGGSTALFAGVSKGAHEVRKFLKEERVNRVILLSDGLANVGPSSPGDLARLGTSFVSEGISVTTIGLGLDYNEDLMAELAQKSNGNHYFAEVAKDLERIYVAEFGDVLSVVAKDVRLVVQFAEGVRPVRALGREAHIVGQRATTTLNQLYSRQQKYLLLELELPPGDVSEEMKVATVDVSYANLATKTTDELRSAVSVTFVDSPSAVEARENPGVMASVVHQIGAEQNRLAMELRDQGKIEEGLTVLKDNTAYLSDNARKYDNDELRDYAKMNGDQVINWRDEGDWKRKRKEMRKGQYDINLQQKVHR